DFIVSILKLSGASKVFEKLESFIVRSIAENILISMQYDADELLCQIAENVPESLETIEIIMDYLWIFRVL
ncbi:734_t:CDS:2, partial [Diversispora eburnea]